MFFIHLDAFGVEKVEELAHEIIFTGETQFRETRSETFRKNFEALNDIFWAKTLSLTQNTSSCYFTHKNISNGTRIVSIGVCMQKLCHLEVDLLVFTPIVQEDVASASIIHGKGASHEFLM